jgi:hypothetical protein
MKLGRCLLGFFVVALLLQGCAFIRGNYGEELGQGDITTIQKGISTRADVTAVLGAPDRIIEANGREIFHYFHFDVKSGSVLIFSRTNIKSDDTFVILNGSGVVEEVVYGKRKGPLEFQFWPFDWPFHYWPFR